MHLYIIPGGYNKYVYGAVEDKEVISAVPKAGLDHQEGLLLAVF